MSDEAANFRKLAEGCRQEAAAAVSAVEKQRWLRLSDEWLKLAQSADRGSSGPVRQF
jgi:hypothetical protein